MVCRTIKTLKNISLIVLLMTGFSSCYYDNEEYLYPASACDTTNVTFSGTVLPTIEQKCLSCHSGPAPEGNLNLENYEQISNAASNLYNRISKPAGDSQLMPPGQKLDDCTIRKIKVWIDDGTPNS